MHPAGLLDALNEVVEEPTLPVSATFKDTRIVNVRATKPRPKGCCTLSLPIGLAP